MDRKNEKKGRITDHEILFLRATAVTAVTTQASEGSPLNNTQPGSRQALRQLAIMPAV